MANYCPSFFSSTYEKVKIKAKLGIEVIKMLACAVNFAEIELKPCSGRLTKKQAGGGACPAQEHIQKETNKRTFRSFLHRVVTKPFQFFARVASPLVFKKVYGFQVTPGDSQEGTNQESTNQEGANQQKSMGYHDCRSEHRAAYIPADAYDDAYATERKRYTVSGYSFALSHINLGQEEDLTILDQVFTYQRAMIERMYPDTQYACILYGHSRGAAAAFHYAALKKNPEIRAVVCEGVFDTVEHIAHASSSALVRFIAHWVPKITNFDATGLQPLTLVSEFPLATPVLLITSYADKIVPAVCTINLYKALRAAGHTKVHILMLERANHVRGYARADEQEKRLYENVVHAFYRHYGLPYRSTCAQAGHDYFIKHTQPNL
jgi:hypothetical protein